MKKIFFLLLPFLSFSQINLPVDFENSQVFNEDIVNRILDDLSGACAPRSMIVKGQFSPRGGIQLTATAAFPDQGTDEL